MEVKVSGKSYKFEVYGTVGLIYKVETMLDGEKVDLGNPRHLITLCYAVFYQCNKHMGDLPDFDEFLCSQTAKSIKDMDSYIGRRWRELEGEPAGKEDAAEGEG